MHIYIYIHTYVKHCILKAFSRLHEFVTRVGYLHLISPSRNMCKVEAMDLATMPWSCWSCWSQVTLDFGSPDLRDLGRLVTNVYYHFRDFTTLFRVKNSGFLETFAGKIQVLEKKYILHAPFVFSSVQFSFNNQTESISFSKDLSGL